MNFDSVEKIAAAILYEGYILYPYRPSAIKNRQRWNFGTLYPRVYAEAQRPPETFQLVAECLLVGDAVLDVRIKFLQLLRRENNEWDEAVERTSEHTLRVSDLLRAPLSLRLEEPTFVLSLTIRAQEVQPGACKLHLEVRNITPLPSGSAAKREEALPLSFVSAHLLLGATGGEFVSLLDPDPGYDEAAADCSNSGVFPVLAGNEPDRSMMLCSPIILYDYPKVAPESAGDFFDGTEMDEMLALRVLTLTDSEKQEMRGSDARARKILERTEALFADNKALLPSVRIFGVEFRVGDRVRLCPRKTADIFDMELKGKIALIEAIEQDFEDRVQLAVVLDDDPGRDFGMMRQPGHRFFFSPEEVEPA